MQSLIVEKPAPFLIGAEEFHITIVGAGGTGSYIVQSVARLMAHCAATGGPPIATIVLDGDDVEPQNVGRQLFSKAEIGRNKAQTLVARFNAAFGLRMEAWAGMATDHTLQNQVSPIRDRDRVRRNRVCNILVGAVDNPEGRLAMACALKSWQYDIWIDSGNHENVGQVVVGTKATKKQMVSTFALAGLCTGLPSPALLYPRLVRKTMLQPQQDCGAAMEDNRQSLMVNEQMATIVVQYLIDIIQLRRLILFETEVNVQSRSMRSTSITASNVARALKMTVEELTATRSVEWK